MQRPSYRYGKDTGHLGRFHQLPVDPEPVYPSHYRLIKYGPMDQPACEKASHDLKAKTDVDQHSAVKIADDDLKLDCENSPLIIEDVDLCVAENTKAHHTDEYELTEFDRKTGALPQLIVRRGEPFEIRIKTDRPYKKDRDNIQIQLEIGKAPKVSKGTDERLPLREELEARKWSTCLESQDGDLLGLTIQAAPNAIIGAWTLCIATSLAMSNRDSCVRKPIVRRYRHGECIYILFNPWCKEDQVYLPDDSWRDEAVLNESGIIYTGNHAQVACRPWIYGQFEDSILGCALDLLEEAQLLLHIRNDPVKVVRAITSVVTGYSADRGVMVGNWSGRYNKGVVPLAWMGSVSILEQHMQKKTPVKFGQCWVFAGICATLCRTLGIPARTVTNFSSARDCDGTVTMDFHWRLDGSFMTAHNDDYIWSFHTWNEAWMARPDLLAGYGGWQAFDSTPQETSEGLLQAGPCSVAAIRDGYVAFSSDAATFFAEVNADKIHWVLKDDATWWISTDKAKVGRKISTKRQRNQVLRRRSSSQKPEDMQCQRLDITDMYKFSEGSERERTAFYRANLKSARTSQFPTNPKDDVKFFFELPTDVIVGNKFELRFKIQNQCRVCRSVEVSFYLTSCHYTGLPRRLVKKQIYDVAVEPIKTQDCVMRVGHDEYLIFCVDHLSFKVKAMATVHETGQIFTSEEEFLLRRPSLTVKVPSAGVIRREEINISVRLINPLPIHLTQCSWRVEGAGIEKLKIIEHGDVEPYDTTKVYFTLCPRRKGKRQFQVCFTSSELSDVIGTGTIDIRE